MKKCAYKDVDGISTIQRSSGLAQVPLPLVVAHGDGINVDDVISSGSMRVSTLDSDVFTAVEPLTCVESCGGWVSCYNGAHIRIVLKTREDIMLVSIDMDLWGDE